MTLIKLRPAREILRDSVIPSQMLNVMDNLFNDSLGKFERHVFFTPRADVAEKEKTYELQVALPGLKKDEVKINVEGDQLTISGERKMQKENNDKYLLVENFYGAFSRTFTLPENTDHANISAELTDGILKLEIPKLEVKETKTSIQIK